MLKCICYIIIRKAKQFSYFNGYKAPTVTKNGDTITAVDGGKNSSDGGSTTSSKIHKMVKVYTNIDPVVR